MKSISIFLFIFLISLHCFSQSWEGEWKGSFTSLNPDPYAQFPFANGGFVTLKFILNKDNSYTVYSYYKADTIHVYEVLYKRISQDLIQLQETKIMKPEHDQMIKCFLKMSLKIIQKKKSIELKGDFNFVPGGNCSMLMPESNIGTISFNKKTEEKSR
jgi:hypothetical protein